MRRILTLILPMIFAIAGTLAVAAPANAASYGVEDNGKLFSADAITKAQSTIREIKSEDNRDVLVVTYDTIPTERQDQFQSQPKAQFYNDWAQEVGKTNGVNGIVILMTKNPGHLEISVGNITRQQSFTIKARDDVNEQMLAMLRQKQFDFALTQGLSAIKQRIRPSTANASDAWNVPDYSRSTNAPIPSTSGFPPVMSWLCAGVAILAVVFFIMKMMNRSSGYRGGGYGYNAPPQGGYPPGYSGGYPQGGGYGGGGGGGFGRGLLGGLLGGALGAWGYEKFNQPSSPNYNPQSPNTGGTGGDFGNSSSNQNDTSFSGTGGDFGSSNDSSASTGGDFGSSSDSSGSSSDFGGGGDSGGGGGGGDFGGGGGGDSGGGSSGGDF